MVTSNVASLSRIVAETFGVPVIARLPSAGVTPPTTGAASQENGQDVSLVRPEASVTRAVAVCSPSPGAAPV